MFIIELDIYSTQNYICDYNGGLNGDTISRECRILHKLNWRIIQTWRRQTEGITLQIVLHCSVDAIGLHRKLDEKRQDVCSYMLPANYKSYFLH